MLIYTIVQISTCAGMYLGDGSKPENLKQSNPVSGLKCGSWSCEAATIFAACCKGQSQKHHTHTVNHRHPVHQPQWSALVGSLEKLREFSTDWSYTFRLKPWRKWPCGLGDRKEKKTNIGQTHCVPIIVPQESE